ncbi:conserved oligomeric Golgi complex subunit 3-like isoform X2 [Acanthaster planci]|uniref:Conserved oligomeric Golgi complex subunit 3 n=1 Tax=Acanthaster planci TaxID=133434 RepID=A0A8B7Y623_ACAPL|nr:conserved oligomeric Golgi complex subunit 3-like isoform X2 [Acanthaster planci]
MSDPVRLFSAKMMREKLSAWEQKSDPKAPLSDVQKDSFMELTSNVSNRPLPIELPLDEPGSFSQQLSMPTVQIPTAGDNALSKGFEALGMKGDKIENAQQFFAWFNKVESQMDHDEEISYRHYCDQLKEYRDQCESVLNEVSDALTNLEDLQKQYVHVSTKTNALHEACEESLQDQTTLVNKAEAISSRLSYFNELERINQKLSSPTFSVTSESFVPMLSKLDECIAHITVNSGDTDSEHSEEYKPHYKESDVYQAKFKHCLTKALSAVRTSVFNILQNATQQVLPKKDLTAESSENAFTLFYGKFRSQAPKVKGMMEQTEQRLDKSSEYQTLLDDCHQYYLNQRQQLLAPSITAAVSELATKHVRDHCALVRSGCAFMVHVCEDEYQLFFHFFSRPTDKLDTMLEGLCMSLYDVLRPLIIHINHLETLAELCSILQIEMLQDHVLTNPDELKAFETVNRQMLEDVQMRLVYRASIYVQTDILNYKPAPGDLAYPEKLEMMESISESLKEKEHEKAQSRRGSGDSLSSSISQEVATLSGGTPEGAPPDRNDSPEGEGESGTLPPKPVGRTVIQPSQPSTNLSPADLHGMWYPTVRRTLVCLSKLYRCIDKAIFQGLSQETLLSCIQSLVTAEQGIVKRQTELDGMLFLIKHLLILREQIAPFQVEFSIKETALDFSTMKVAAYSFLSKRSRIFSLSSNNAFLEFLFEGAPNVTEHFLDSKKDVDTQLKKTCEQFIKHVTDTLIPELNSFLTKATVIIDMNKESEAAQVSLRKQPFATAEKVHEVVSATYRQVKSRLPSVFRKMSLYLANKDTEYILFRPVKSNVQQAYQQFEGLVKENYPEEDQQIIGCPTMEQVNLLLSTAS